MDGDASGEAQVTRTIDAPPPTGPPSAPAGAAPDPLAAAAAGPSERGRLRRRLRRLKQARERQWAELGTLVVDARKRSNGSRPEVVDRRAAEAAELDRQVRELSYAVSTEPNPRAIATGVRGSCAGCGSLIATEDRFCPSCGTPTKPGRARPADTSPVEPRLAAPAPAPVPAPAASGPPPPSPTTPYAAVDPAKIPPPPPPPAAESPRADAPAVPAAPAAPPIPEPPAPAAEQAGYAHVDRSTIPPPPPPPAG